MTNPYAVGGFSKTAPPDAMSDLVRFDGIITADDFRRLMPERRLVWVLNLIVLGIMLPMLGGIAVAMLWGPPRFVVA